VCTEVLAEKVQQQDAADYVLDLKAVCDPAYAQWSDADVYNTEGKIESISMCVTQFVVCVSSKPFKSFPYKPPTSPCVCWETPTVNHPLHSIIHSILLLSFNGFMIFACPQYQTCIDGSDVR
jgi:hypothetical protein